MELHRRRRSVRRRDSLQSFNSPIMSNNPHAQKIEKEITIVNRLGLGARPAAMFVRIASQFRSEISVEREGERINGKSIMGLMMLAAAHGSKLHILCEGPDADREIQELEELIKNGFNEDCSDSESQRYEPGLVGLQKKFSEIK